MLPNSKSFGYLAEVHKDHKYNINELNVKFSN